MSNKSNQNRLGHSKLMHYGMMICCTVMLLPIAWFLVAGGSLSGLWSNAAFFAPLLLCVGAHFVMHKMMGKSCHGASEEEKQVREIPFLTDGRVKEPQSQGPELNRKWRALLVGFAGLWVSGCASTLAECIKQDDVSVSSKNAFLIAPQGCKLEGSTSGLVQAISCENGRQGFVIAN